MVRDTAGNTVYEAEYAPYGDVQSETGTNPSEFGYVVTLGYVKDTASSLYVRARYLLTNLGRWLTKDPLWPEEDGYVYAGAAPNRHVDPSGLRPWYYNCFYKFLYTSDCNAYDDVYESALEGGFRGVTCYLNCMKDLNLALLGLVGALAALFLTGIPKPWLPTWISLGRPGTASIMSIISVLLNKLSGLSLRFLLAPIKKAFVACIRDPKQCAGQLGLLLLGLNVIFAGSCAAICSRPCVESTS